MISQIDAAYMQMHPHHLFTCRNKQSEYVKNVTEHRRYLDAIMRYDENTITNLDWIYKYEHILDQEITEHLFSEAARRTGIDVLEWLVAKGCKYTPEASLLAIKHCKIENLKWMLAQGYEMYGGCESLSDLYGICNPELKTPEDIEWIKKNC